MTGLNLTLLRIYLLLIFSFLACPGYSGIFIPNEINKVVDEIYTETYHFHFLKADSLILLNDPVYNKSLEFNLAVVNYYWWRLISGTQNSKFSSLVAKRIEKIKALNTPDKSHLQKEQLFLLISIYAYSARVKLLDYSYYSALTDLSHYYSLLKESFGKENDYKSFYLTSGLYYFFAGYVRQKMPLLSPLLFYYTPGNMGKGIQYIIMAESSGDSKISQEAKYFLMKINFDIYKNYSESAKYCNQLLAVYPGNLLFQSYIFRISLALDQEIPARARLTMMERTARNNNQLTADEKGYYLRQAKADLAEYNKKKNKHFNPK